MLYDIQLTDSQTVRQKDRHSFSAEADKVVYVCLNTYAIMTAQQDVFLNTFSNKVSVFP